MLLFPIDKKLVQHICNTVGAPVQTLKTQTSTHFTAGTIQTDYQSDQFVTTEGAVVLKV